MWVGGSSDAMRPRPGPLTTTMLPVSASAASAPVRPTRTGSSSCRRAARASARLPLLAKGFFTTEDDLRTAREAGAEVCEGYQLEGLLVEDGVVVGWQTKS